MILYTDYCTSGSNTPSNLCSQNLLSIPVYTKAACRYSRSSMSKQPVRLLLGKRCKDHTAMVYRGLFFLVQLKSKFNFYFIVLIDRHKSIYANLYYHILKQGETQKLNKLNFTSEFCNQYYRRVIFVIYELIKNILPKNSMFRYIVAYSAKVQNYRVTQTNLQTTVVKNT